MFAERKDMFWRRLSEAQNASSVNPCGSCAKALAAAEMLAKRAKNQTDNSVRVGPIIRAKS